MSGRKSGDPWGDRIILIGNLGACWGNSVGVFWNPDEQN